jgi:hypothetical protein
VEPSLQCEKETFVTIQAATALEEYTILRTFGKEQQLRWEYKRINCRDSRQQIRLRMKRTSDRCYRKPMKLEMANVIFGFITGVQVVNGWTFGKVRPPPKRRKNVLTA